MNLAVCLKGKINIFVFQVVVPLLVQYCDRMELVPRVDVSNIASL